VSTKHTPGPWTCAYGRAGSFEIVSVDGSVLCIRSPWNYRCKESVDNGSLIAAAPDLLEALRLAEERLGSHPVSENDNYDVLPKIRAAIAAAEGRS